jgi:hypothetical protein
MEPLARGRKIKIHLVARSESLACRSADRAAFAISSGLDSLFLLAKATSNQPFRRGRLHHLLRARQTYDVKLLGHLVQHLADTRPWHATSRRKYANPILDIEYDIFA